MPQILSLVIACGTSVHDKAGALFDGRVAIQNCSAAHAPLASGEMLVRSFEDPAFNVAELSLSNYVTLRAQGRCPYTAIPVYIARSFRHADVYVRTDRGIRTPHDLRGRRVGLTEYHHTAYVWTRGILADEYQVPPAQIRWVCITKATHAGPTETPFQPPAGVAIEHVHTDKPPSAMLADGEIDALIAPRAPECYTRGTPHISRLFANHQAEEDGYCRRSGIFPILHLMGIRNELVARHPGLARDLFRAFLRAKDLALAAEKRAAMMPGAAPELAARVKRMQSLLGEDYHSYGLGERDRRTLAVFLRYHFEQGLSDRHHEIADLFAPVPLSAYGA